MTFAALLRYAAFSTKCHLFPILTFSVQRIPMLVITCLKYQPGHL